MACPVGSVSQAHTRQVHGLGKHGQCFSVSLLWSPVFLAGSGKNDNAEKMAEKLEALSVKEESKESEDKETKEKAEEKQ